MAQFFKKKGLTAVVFALLRDQLSIKKDFLLMKFRLSVYSAITAHANLSVLLLMGMCNSALLVFQMTVQNSIAVHPTLILLLSAIK